MDLKWIYNIHKKPNTLALGFGFGQTKILTITCLG